MLTELSARTPGAIISLTAVDGQMSEQNPLLDAAIDHLYTTFSAYPLNPQMSGCPCCVFPEDLNLIKAAPLRRLPRDSLEKFASKAVTTWGEIEDFKHFLPRLLEFELTGDPDFTPSVHEKLEYCAWRTWPMPEQAAIAASIEASAISLLSIWPADRRLSDVLYAAIALGIDMSAFVAAWDHLKQRPSAIRHLAALVVSDFDYDFVVLPPASTVSWRQLRAWLLDRATEQSLIDAYLADGVGAANFAPVDMASIALAADILAARQTVRLPRNQPG